MKVRIPNSIVIGVLFLLVFTLSCSRDKTTGPDDSGEPRNPADVEWIKTANPGGGPVLSLAIDTAGSIFAGTDHGGVFKSVDNGVTWTPFNNGLIVNTVEALAIDGNDRIYAGISDGGLFRSGVASDNWINIGPGDTTIWAIAINSGGHIFAASSAGLYRSMDDAISWTPINNGLMGSIVLSLAVNSRDELFAGTNTKGLFFSGDSGANWSQTALTAGTILSVGVSADNHVYVGYLGAGMYYSTDGGFSWASPASGFSPTIVYDYAINSDGYVFASGYGEGVLRSTDKGANWEAKNSGLTSTFIYALALDKDQHLFAGSDSGYVYYTLNSTGIPPIDPGGN